MYTILDRRQKAVLLAALAGFLLLGLVVPWRYMDGRFAGYSFITSPPDPLPDSVQVGKPAVEHVPIYFIPSQMVETDRKSEFSAEEMRRPFLDVRRMLAEAATLFLAAAAVLALLERRKRRERISAPAGDSGPHPSQSPPSGPET